MGAEFVHPQRLGSKIPSSLFLGLLIHVQNRRIFNAPMLSAYFDTNVYDQIDKGRIPSAELDVLRSALKDGRLIGYLGIPVIVELLGQWETDRVAGPSEGKLGARSRWIRQDTQGR